MSTKKRLIFSLGNGILLFLLLCVGHYIIHSQDCIQQSAIWAISWSVGMFVGKSIATLKKNIFIKILFSVATIISLLILFELIIFCFNLQNIYFIYILLSYGFSVIVFTFI